MQSRSNAKLFESSVGSCWKIFVLSIAPIASRPFDDSQYRRFRPDIWSVSTDALMLKYSVGSTYSMKSTLFLLYSYFGTERDTEEREYLRLFLRYSFMIYEMRT